MTDPCKLTPSALCRLLNSTPLGEVASERQVRLHRARAGLRIGDSRHVDLVRYVAWLLLTWHAPRPERPSAAPSIVPLAEAAQGAAAVSSRSKPTAGHGQKLTSKQELLIAALLTEPSYAAAAAKAGISETTIYRWLQRAEFRTAYRRARRELIESAIGRIQAATGQAVATLVAVATHGRRDSDRVRASIALLNHALRGLGDADLLHGQPPVGNRDPIGASDVVETLAARLRQTELAELSTSEKSRLTATLADALLRAIGVDVLDKRLEALQAVLVDRKRDKTAKKP